MVGIADRGPHGGRGWWCTSYCLRTYSRRVTVVTGNDVRPPFSLSVLGAWPLAQVVGSCSPRELANEKPSICSWYTTNLRLSPPRIFGNLVECQRGLSWAPAAQPNSKSLDSSSRITVWPLSFFFGVVASNGCAGSFTLLDRIVHLEEMLYALAVSTALCGTPRTGVA